MENKQWNYKKIEIELEKSKEPNRLLGTKQATVKLFKDRDKYDYVTFYFSPEDQTEENYKNLIFLIFGKLEEYLGKVIIVKK